jgi:hypothetical protein
LDEIGNYTCRGTNPNAEGGENYEEQTIFITINGLLFCMLVFNNNITKLLIEPVNLINSTGAVVSVKQFEIFSISTALSPAHVHALTLNV